MKKLILLLLAVSALTSCDKEEDDLGLDYPSTFTLYKHYNTTPVRMFTANGEVQDQARIRAFAQRTGVTPNYFLDSKVVNVSSSEEVTFLKSSEAEVNTGSRKDAYEVSSKENDLVLTAKTESTILSNNSEAAYVSFINAISKHKPLKYNEKPLSAGTGYSSLYTTRTQIITSLNAGELHVHSMAHTLKSGNQTSYSIRYATAFNKFNPAGTSQLKATDTLLVQEFVMVGQKR